jgi:hypothetical protein
MRRLLLATAATGLLVTPAVAHADAPAVMSGFRVTAEGTGQYERTDRQVNQGLGWDEHTASAFSYKVVLPMVWFDADGRLMGEEGRAGGPTTEGVLSGTASSHMNLYTAEGTKVGDCFATLQDLPVKTMTVERVGAAADGELLGVTPLSSIAFPADCTGNNAGTNLVAVMPGGTNAMTQIFDMPKEAVDNDKIIQHVSQTPAQKMPINCPGLDTLVTVSCSFTWSGKVTFDRVSRIEMDPEIEIGHEDDHGHDDPPPPAPAPAPVPAPVPVPGRGPGVPLPAPAKDPQRALRVAGTPRLDARRGRATVSVACAAGCAGRVDAYIKSKRVATKRFTARAGRATKVTVRLDAKAARRAKAVRLVVSAGGAKTTVTAR